MVRVHGQDIERIADDPIVERYDVSGFQGVGRHKVALFFGGGGGGGGDQGPSIEEQQQQRFAEARDREYNKTFSKVAAPWLKRVKADAFSQADRAAIAAGRGNADIEQQAAQTSSQGLRAALAAGADLGNLAPTAAGPVAAVADAKRTMRAGAEKAGAQSRLQEQTDAIRLGQDNMQMQGQGLSALTSFGTDNQVRAIADAGASEAGKWNTIAQGIGMAGQMYQGSLDDNKMLKSGYDREMKLKEEYGVQGPHKPFQDNWAGKIDNGLRSVFNAKAWGF